MIELASIISKLKPEKIVGPTIGSVLEVESFNPENDSHTVISWLSEKNKEQAYFVKAGIVICPDTVEIARLPENATFLLFTNPREAFRLLVLHFFVKDKNRGGISSTAVIGKNVKLGTNVSIGNYTVIEDNVIIGANVTILHNNSILSDTVIGNNVLIGCNNTIGGIGFGYEKDSDNQYQAIPHIGNVLIEDFVEIGNNTCIDRAVLGSTKICRNAKVDNLVHIAHGCVIGDNSLVIAHAMIGGSSIIGKNVWVAPNSAIINKVSIGDDTVIGMGAVVLSSVPELSVVVGNPAKPLKPKDPK